MASLIVIASEKGGCGKTKLALNTSIELAKRGNKVTLVDLDNKKEYDWFLSIRKKANPKYDQNIFDLITSIAGQDAKKKFIDFYKNIYLKAGKDHIFIVDTPGRDSDVNRMAITASSLIIAPLNTDTAEVLRFGEYLETLEQLQEEISLTGENKKIDLHCVLTRVNPTKTEKTTKEAKEEALRYPDLKLLQPSFFNTTIRNYTSYNDAYKQGLGVTEYYTSHGSKRDIESFSSELENLIRSK
jgi:chromosome partitioning protein